MTIENIKVFDAETESEVEIGVNVEGGFSIAVVQSNLSKLQKIDELLPTTCSTLNHDIEYCELVNKIKEILNDQG